MAFVRYNTKREKDAEGRWLCKVCKAPCGGRRTAYCGNECWYRNTPSIMRSKVYRRDKGVCSQCGLDTEKLPTPKHWTATVHRWEADHIVPVSEGGGLCGLEGYRTLCKGPDTNNCHGKVSGELRKRLNEAKRAETIQRETGMLFELTPERKTP